MSNKVHFNFDPESNQEKISDNGHVKTKSSNLSSHSQLPSKQLKALLCLVGVLVAFTVCVMAASIVTAVFITRRAPQQSEVGEHQGDPTIDMAKREALLRQVN